MSVYPEIGHERLESGPRAGERVAIDVRHYDATISAQKPGPLYFVTARAMLVGLLLTTAAHDVDLNVARAKAIGRLDEYLRGEKAPWPWV